jgi:hypothetical protein
VASPFVNLSFENISVEDWRRVLTQLAAECTAPITTYEGALRALRFVAFFNRALFRRYTSLEKDVVHSASDPGITLCGHVDQLSAFLTYCTAFIGRISIVVKHLAYFKSVHSYGANPSRAETAWFCTEEMWSFYPFCLTANVTLVVRKWTPYHALTALGAELWGPIWKRSTALGKLGACDCVSCLFAR